MNNQSEIDRASDIATQYALQEILRHVVGHVFFNPDVTEFKSTMQKLEEACVTGIRSRTIFPSANQATEAFIKESASAFVTKLISSIRHPDESGNNNT